jgi:hypothetical protein
MAIACKLGAPDLSEANLKRIFEDATKAANTAGDKWMAEHSTPAFVVRDVFTGKIEGTMLDSCGNAHVVPSDKRSAFFKALKKFKILEDDRFSCVLPIYHEWRSRQEHGLQLACARAAINVFNEHNIYAVKIWEYID